MGWLFLLLLPGLVAFIWLAEVSYARPGYCRRDHSRCSIYAPCRKADLEASWQAFKRAVDDPATRGTAIRMELLRMAQGRDADIS